MEKRLILDEELINIVINRLSYQLHENHDSFSNSVILGLQPKGIYLANRIQDVLLKNFNIKVEKGNLDPTFNRDDFRRRDIAIIPNSMHIPFSLEDKKVILVDDVLYTGRTIRAALDALLAYGRPKLVELLILINRKYTRELPIEPKYIGKSVNTLLNERVLVGLKEQGLNEEGVWLITKNYN